MTEKQGDTIEDFIAPEESAGTRLDTWIARRQSERSRTFFQQLIKDGKVLVNGAPAKRSAVLEGGEAVTIHLPPAENPWPAPEDLPVDILYEDDELIVVNKAAGMIVHPAPGNPDGTLVNALLHHCPDLPGINGVKRPGIVHRLDRDTSGVMVVAKTDRAMNSLARQIQARTVSRIYCALVLGEPAGREGTVDAPIGRDGAFRIRRTVGGIDSRHAVTHWRALARAHGFGLLRCALETGRTHQIRVHCHHMGHPIAGDDLYDGAGPRVKERAIGTPQALRTALAHLDRPFLHARLLTFNHPVERVDMTFRAPFPDKLAHVLQALMPDAEPESWLAEPDPEAPTDE